MIPLKRSKDIMDNMGVFSWGGVEIDLDAIPNETFVGLAKAGIRHKLANEVASGLIKVKEKAGESFDEETETLALRQSMVQKILDGTVGLRIGGPRGSTIENIAWELAMKQAENSLAPKGYWPKADRKNGVKAEDATIEFAGQAMTREMLTDMVYDKYKDKLLEEAKIEHAARMEKAKLAKQNTVKAVSAVEESADQLL
jgi:hypothetical protein